MRLSNTTLKTGYDKGYSRKTTGSPSEPVVSETLEMTINKSSQLRLSQSAYFLSSNSAVLKED